MTSLLSSLQTAFPAAFSTVSFAWPWMLALLPLPWIVRRFAPSIPPRDAALRAPWGERLVAVGGRIGPARARTASPLLWAVWALLCVAAARPQQLGDVVQPPQSGRDMMLALDLSGSMETYDMRFGGQVVQRVVAAKAVLADFLDRRAGDRVGLVVFGDRAFVLTPLTRDLDSVREQLAGTEVGLPGRGTAIGDAIALATRRLRALPSDRRVLVLLTDGVNEGGVIDPLKAAALARDSGVRIHTIAFGGGDADTFLGMPLSLPGGDGGVDEATLQQVAKMTGGRAFVARDVDQLVGIYAEIDRIEPVKFAGQRLRPREERYPWPLAAAFACALLMLWRRRSA